MLEAEINVIALKCEMNCLKKLEAQMHCTAEQLRVEPLTLQFSQGV